MPSPGDVVREVVNNPGGVGMIGEDIQQVASAIAREAFAAGPLGEAAFTDATGSALTAAFELYGGWIIVLAVVGIAILVRVVDQTMQRFLLQLPWGWGKGPARMVALVFSPYINLENWAAQRAEEFAGQAATQLYDAGRSFLLSLIPTIDIPQPSAQPSKTPSPTFTGPGGPSSVLTNLQTRVDILERAVANIEGVNAHQAAEITALQRHVYGTSPNTGQITTIEERVYRLEQGYYVIAHDLNVLHSDVVTLDKAVQTVQSELTPLEQNLNAVRAVQFGVQDVLSTVENMTKLLQDEMTAIMPEVQANTDELLLLHPLHQLLYLGQPGLNKLKRLEENPCQCPSFGGISSPLLEALAIEVGIANGF